MAGLVAEQGSMNWSQEFESFKKRFSLKPGDARVNAFSEFQRHGLPSRDSEDFRYTPLQYLQQEQWSVALNLGRQMAPGAHQKIIDSVNKKSSNDFYNLVFYNGYILKAYSSFDELKDSLQIIDENSPLFKVEGQRGGLDHLRESFGGQGCKLIFKKKLDKPVHIQHFTGSEGFEKWAIFPSHEIHLETGAQVSLLESWTSVNSKPVFIAPRTRVTLANKARFEYVRYQDEHINSLNFGRTDFEVAGDCEVNVVSITKAAKIARHEIRCALKGERSIFNCYGLYHVGENQFADHNTVIEHQVGDCRVDQLYKGVLGANGKSVFSGLIKICPDAQKAVTAQLNKNLLLDPKAEANSKPQLLILADDVKATHGSTVGQINPDEIFYFQSRGISKEQALKMLTTSFAEEILYKVENKVIQNWALSQYRGS